MKCHTGNISFRSVIYANVIFERHDSAVVDIPKHGQDLQSAAEFINRHVVP